MSRQRGLGRGFDSLIPTEVTADMPASVQPAAGDSVRQVKPGSIRPNPHQPRAQFDAAELQGLADSIRQFGILQPLVVSDGGSGSYELIAGERRLRAAKLAGLAEVPVIVRSFDEQEKLELALLENLQRSELNPMETAAAYRKLSDEFNLSLDEIAKRMGKAKSTVANVMRLLQLPPAARKAVASGAISEAHGRAILAVTSLAEQEVLLAHIIQDGWTVRQAEVFARGSKPDARVQPTQSGTAAAQPPADSQLAARLGKYLGTTVRLQPTAKGGRLVIDYRSEADLQRIAETIKPPE